MRYTRANPSPRYHELLAQYRMMHVHGEQSLQLAPQNTFPGHNLPTHAVRIKRLIDRMGANSVLDYGSGKGYQYRPMLVSLPSIGQWPSIQDYWGVDDVQCYDPGYEPFNALPEIRYDGVVSTDVLEHCPQEDMPWIVDEMFGFAKRFVYANIACYAAVKHLPNGENAHCTIKPIQWWQALLDEITVKYPLIVWEILLAYIIDTPRGRQYKKMRLQSAQA